MNNELFSKNTDYWKIAEVIRDIYMSDGSISTLLDFEGVLDEVDLYAFKNWILGELVEGPIVNRYTVSCTFMWPHKRMPDPRGAKRLLPFDCRIKWKKTKMSIPKEIKKPEDFRDGMKKAKLIKIPIWLVEITMPKNLIAEIRSGNIELEGEEIDLADLDLGYEEDLDQAANKDNIEDELADTAKEQEDLGNEENQFG